MKVIFLDVDGVLNNLTRWPDLPRYGESLSHRIDPEAVARLKAIIDRTGAVIVVSSTWRRVDDSMWALRAALREGGIPGRTIIGTTPVLTCPHPGSGLLIGSARRDEIRRWLMFERNPRAEAFVVLDDSDDASLDGHFVQTTWNEGLLDAHVEQAVAILGGSAIPAAQEGQ